MKTVTRASALILILLIIVGSVFAQLNRLGDMPRASSRAGDLQQTELWSYRMSGGAPDTLKVIDLTGDEDEIFAATAAQVAILSHDGSELLNMKLNTADSAKVTSAQLSDDAMEEFVVAEHPESALRVHAYDSRGAELWSTLINDVQAAPTRGFALDFDGDGIEEVIFGTENGVVVCLEGQTGAHLWSYTFSGYGPEESFIKGSDDVQINGQTYLAVAVDGGNVAIIDINGQALWENAYPEKVRRLRASDMDGDGVSEILVGAKTGQLRLVSAATGETLWEKQIDGKPSEVRFLELDNQRSQREVIVGDVEGNLAAYSLNGDSLWTKRMAGEIRELATLDFDGNEENELLIGADKLYVLDARSGNELTNFAIPGINTISVGDLESQGAYSLGTAAGVSAYRLSRKPSTEVTNSNAGTSGISPLIVGGLLIICVIGLTMLAEGFIIPAAQNVVRKRLPVKRAPLKSVYKVAEITLFGLEQKKARLEKLIEQVRHNEDSMGSIYSLEDRLRVLEDKIAAQSHPPGTEF